MIQNGLMLESRLIPETNVDDWQIITVDMKDQLQALTKGQADE